jgi:hypothetical protein
MVREKSNKKCNKIDEKSQKNTINDTSPLISG